MSLRIFSSVGQALNFPARQFETVLRVAWLPVILLLIVDMTTVLAMLSVIFERTVTLKDGISFAQAERALGKYLQHGWNTHPVELATIASISAGLQLILVSSGLAPLIRFAGLGERPASGVVRLPFGADQCRYALAVLLSGGALLVLVIAPLFVSALFILKFIAEILSQVMVVFPDSESLHTIKLITRADSLALQGMGWLTSLAIPIAAAAPFGLLFWAVIFFHCSPQHGGVGRWLVRGITTLVGALVFLGCIFWLLSGTVTINGTGNVSGAPAKAIFMVFLIVILLFSYLNIRLFPYAGIAVAQESMGLGATLALSRRWNFVRLTLLLMLVSAIVIGIGFILNVHVVGWLGATIGTIYQLVASSSRLLNSGDTADWILPVFALVWKCVKILLNISYSVFSFGVFAGLYGALYRESRGT